MRWRTLSLGGALVVGSLPLVVTADDPDLREIRPAVTLLVDTSGSMEYEIDATDGSQPTCGGVSALGVPRGTNERSRWITAVEALTGSFTPSTYACQSLTRSTIARDIAGYDNLDYDYSMTFHRPMGTQQVDGILDVFRDRVTFGLMSYDSMFGLRLAGRPVAERDRVPRDIWTLNNSLVPSVEGGFSYGPDRIYTYYRAPTTYMVNGGVRGRRTRSGGAIGMIPYAAYGSDHLTTNEEIQLSLLAARPFNGTPTAAMLDDFEWFLQNDPAVRAPTTQGGVGDPFAACRRQYAILLTDGQPNDPTRSGSTSCATLGPGGETFSCPYDLSDVYAQRLCNFSGTACRGPLDGLFVVGFRLGSNEQFAAQGCTISPTTGQVTGCTRPDRGSALYAALSELERVASLGGTAYPFLANDHASLVRAMTTALDAAAPATTTRTAPAFVGAGGSSTDQAEVHTGFVVGNATRPWRGILDRTRYVCDSSLVPRAQTLDASRDRFHAILDARTAPRRVLSVVAPRASAVTSTLIGTQASAFGGAPGGAIAAQSLANFEVSNAALTPEYFGLAAADVATRTATITWTRADAGSGRERARLGDIFHSSPVIVSAPRSDIADESFNLFRRRPEVAARPSVLYVGTNDGALHAFSLDRTPSGSVREGDELWAFVPPALMPRLPAARNAHTFLVDATPVVRDVFFSRESGALPDGALYHSVLLTGLRQGGAYFEALDVTDPERPSFLWQFTHDDLGETYGQPALAQVLVDWQGHRVERAIAILPGGRGTLASAESCTRSSANRIRTSGAPRSRTAGHCWRGGAHSGRSLYVVDVATGTLLRSFGPSELDSPMVGSVGVFTNDIGSIATRAYLTDSDGLLFRLDLTSATPSEWKLEPFFDLYGSAGPLDGHPSVYAPVVSIDPSAQPVVILASADPDNLESPGTNFVASIGEERASATEAVARVHWDIRLQPNEQVTGSIELFDGHAYFGTFASGVDNLDACRFGESRLWGVHYLLDASSGSTPTVVPRSYSSPSGRFPVYGMTSAATVTTPDVHFVDAGTNQIVMGVGVTQRPTCVVGTPTFDPYLGAQRFNVDRTGGGGFELVAQVSGGGGTQSTVSTITRTLPPPSSSTRAWAAAGDLER